MEHSHYITVTILERATRRITGKKVTKKTISDYIAMITRRYKICRFEGQDKDGNLCVI